MTSQWTEERCNELRKLVEQDGLSASKAAAVMGVTRNTVSGQCFRRGIMFQQTQQGRPRLSPVRLPKPQPKPVVAIPEATLANGDFITMATLMKGMCKFPIGDPKKTGFHFCGNTTDKGRMYCPQHHETCYGAPQPRTGAPGVVRK